MNPLVYTRDQAAVETVDFSRRICSKEGKDGPIGRKGDGHRFLGFTRCDLHRLPGEGQNDHRALLCRIIRPIRRRIAEKTAPFGEEKSALSPWQRTGSHLRRRHGQISRIRLRTAAPSTAFSRFGPVRLLFDSKLEIHSPGRNLSPMRRLSPPRRPTLQTSRKRVFQTD